MRQQTNLSRDLIAFKAIAQGLKKTSEPEESFPEFVGNAWKVLEPSTPYIPNWHIDLICEHLEAVSLGLCRRLVINLPPRSMKSTLATVAWPAWVWSWAPWKRFIMASYSQSLSFKHSIDRRDVISSPWYQGRHGAKFYLSEDQNQKAAFANDKRGVMIATSVGGSVTGKGGDVIIADDLMDPMQAHSEAHRRNALEFYKRVLTTRLNDKERGAIVIVEQRVHETDLSGTVTKQGGWTHLRLPAEAEENERFTAPISGRVFERQAGEVLWKARESQAALNSQKIAMGTQAYVGQYQQRPSPIEGGMFKRAWWRRLKILPRIHRIIWTWDTALTDKETSAYTSGVKIGEFDQGFVLMKFVRARLEYPDLKRKVKDCAAEQCHAVVIEDKSSGQILIQEFQRELRVPVIPSPAHKDKVTRAKLASPYVEAGRVYLMEDEPGAVDFVEECAAFPNGEFDDQVDSFSHGMAYLTQGPGKPASALSGANLISAPRPDWH